MLFPRMYWALGLWFLCTRVAGLAVGSKPNQIIKPYKRNVLQDIVTWDEHSLFVHGERIMLFNGEYHPFRLPVPSLYLDVFQKIKALGFSGVSFYTDWALLEGKEGNFIAEGIFALEPFFQAASEAGIYLVARPGPYINAEVSGGGYPGWMQRTKPILRTLEYFNYTDNYVKNIAAIIAKAQITNGGPIILFQPENEYTYASANLPFPFPDKTYFQAVEDQFRAAGIVVPYVSNDAAPKGYFAPGTGKGSVDIYGHDGYPLGFDCANPYTWPDNALPTNWHTLHLNQSPSTPYTISEFQGGSFDPWGGATFDKCTTLVNQEFERVFFKNDFSFGVTIFNVYMIYGGTNWGNLGHPGGYTSYDYGAAIAEDRTVAREKYSEAKLEANFLKASPAYLTAVPGNVSNGSFVNSDAIAVTHLVGNVTSFYVVRHAAYNSLVSTNYRLTVSTSRGTISIPQLSPTLTLNGRDSKIHVVDYDVGGTKMLYSSAEVFTWKKHDQKTVLILYGASNETHEAAFVVQGSYKHMEGPEMTSKSKNGIIVVNWAVTPNRRIVKIGVDLYVYLLDRNDAYNYWVVNLPGPATVNNFTVPTASSVIVRAGYLVRTAVMKESQLYLTGDLNSTTTIEVVGGAPRGCALYFNGKSVPASQDRYRVATAIITYVTPNFDIPKLVDLDWKYVDSLPEIQSTYDDSKWTNADLATTINPRALMTPTSLYGSDYGYNTDNLIYRGRFVATGAESTLFLHTQGGSAFGSSVFLNGTFVGSWPGIDRDADYNQTLTLPSLRAGQLAILTIIMDNMGLDENFQVGPDQMKRPRGILDYSISGRDQSVMTWKITGNLGGEDYRDRTRGPLNEGGLYAERQGYHLPLPPSGNWKSSKPTDGITSAGVALYTTSFMLNVPHGYDIPMSFSFANSTTGNGSSVPNYRVQLYVNGYQFGKYVNNVGPQTSFPVPEGILNYHGTNYLALSLWALDAAGAKIENIELASTASIQSGYGPVSLSPMPAYTPRVGAY